MTPVASTTNLPSIKSSLSTSPPRARLIRFWVGFVLVIQLASLSTSLQALRADAKANEPNAKAEDVEWSVLWSSLADGVFVLELIPLMIVMISDPTYTGFPLAQIASALLVIVQRSLLSRQNHQYLGHEYKESYIVDSTFFVTCGFFILRRRCKQIWSTFTPGQIREFVYSSSLSTVLSTMASVMFVVG